MTVLGVGHGYFRKQYYYIAQKLHVMSIYCDERQWKIYYCKVRQSFKEVGNQLYLRQPNILDASPTLLKPLSFQPARCNYKL